MQNFPTFFTDIHLKLSKWIKIILIFKLGSFFESEETESIEHSFKIHSFPTFFTDFHLKLSKWIKIILIFKLGSFFEFEQTESIEHSVKMQNFPTFLYKTVEIGQIWHTKCKVK